MNQEPFLVADFNSIKVRLEQQNNTNTTQAPAFQFHKGAIRTKGIRRAVSSPSYFNSIKVRLELFYSGICNNFFVISIP